MKINKDPKVREFSYKAKVKRGKVIKKKITTSSKEEAKTIISDMDLTLISIKDITPLFIINSDIKDIELISFFRKFASYIRASLSPVSTINILLNENYSYSMKLFLAELRESFKAGLPANVALKKTGLITNQTAKLVEIGEKTGTLPNSLEEISNLLEQKIIMKKKLKKALIKPSFTILFVFAIVAFVVPTMIEPIKGIFQSIGNGDIPPLTKAVLNTTDFLKQNIIYLFISLILFLIGIISLYTSNKKAKKQFDRIIFNLPILGPFIQSSYIFLFFITLNMFIQSGFSLLQALKEITSSLNNNEIKEDINAIAIEIKNGKPLSKAILQSVYIPDKYKESLYSGEKTGSLKKDLENIIYLSNKTFEEEGDKVVLKLTTTISAFVMGIVGLVIFSVYMPMFSLMGAINKTLTE
jgi:type IV pilus assembly protein PilC